jgi:hypothetical protein
VDAAAAIRGYQAAQNTACTLDAVAHRLGYSAPRVFSRQLRELTGHTLSGWRHLDVAHCVDIIRGRLTPPPPPLRRRTRRGGTLPRATPRLPGSGNRIPPLEH